MLDLTRQEKIILLFLTAFFAAGLGLRAYKNRRQAVDLSVVPYETEAAREKADRFIERQRFVNINTFEVDELTRLPGVGKKLAQRIIEYHSLNGPFKAKKELLRVAGIGEKKFEKLEDLITLEGEK